MILRVDDFPTGKFQLPITLPDKFLEKSYESFLRMYEIVRAPMLLGVVPYYLDRTTLDKLLSLPYLELAVHGVSHRQRELDRPDQFEEVLAISKALMGARLFIPPHNHLNNRLISTLHGLGFKASCAGPGTPHNLIVPEGFKLIDSTWYDHCTNLVRESFDKTTVGPACLTLHLTWEANDEFKALPKVMDKVRSRITNWDEALK